MVVRGRTTVHLAVTVPRSVKLTNDDAVHATYVDLYRPATDQSTRRRLDPGDSEIIALAPGPVEITLGPGVLLEDA